MPKSCDTLFKYEKTPLQDRKGVEVMIPLMIEDNCYFLVIPSCFNFRKRVAL